MRTLLILTVMPVLASGISIRGSEELMAPKAHGTCPAGPQSQLRWGCDWGTADRICCRNRHYAEHSGYWLQTDFLRAEASGGEVTFYDSITGKPLFVAPRGRSWNEFVEESRAHGWPSFRDAEVHQESVRVLQDGETVSVDGTHLGHNLPDGSGNRYCINLVSVAGRPAGVPETHKSYLCCLLYTSPSPRDRTRSRMPSSA
eukprot:TRINITY_DN49779_c0_g2_i2.p1 TRINITY_DN49779_c0_g2~~TRINITY_DN49779_c0_g2_i2.p1  ORF type:complete len:201 (+),score=16.80 TRINITY_DN49779_c0_g2_i2:141-743(+)